MQCDDDSMLQLQGSVPDGAAFGAVAKAQYEQTKLGNLWCPEDKPIDEAIDEFLSFIPTGGYDAQDWRITGDQLRRVVRRKNTCAGLDGWAANVWRGLPVE